MMYEYGSATIRPFSSHGDYLHITIVRHKAEFMAVSMNPTSVSVTINPDQAADLFAALAEYLPMRRDEGEEVRFAEIMAAAGVADTPD
jgi:hypothetical protein